MEPKTRQDYEAQKLPFVKKQFGVYDKVDGQVYVCSGYAQAKRAKQNDAERYILMDRSVSEWTVVTYVGEQEPE
jgi:hypothetical protein